MRLVATASVAKGAILGKAIYNDRGKVLLNQGVELDEKLLERLEGMGIHYIYVTDSKTEDIIVKEPLSVKVRQKAIQTIESNFTQIQDERFLSGSIVLEKATKDFKTLIKYIVSEIKQNDDLLVLLSDIFTYDHYIFTHSLNVTMYSLAIGLQLNLPPKDLEILGLGAILHDVGKMKVDEHILLKPGRLTEDEYEEIKKHAEQGYNILRKIPGLPLIVAHCAFQHHERLDGSGYPRGIQGSEIHDFGKIIAVADVFDAVTSNRVYRRAMLPHEGLEILYAGSGSLYESSLIEAFRQAVAIYPAGITVELSDGRKGVVSRQNKGLSDRPTVRIFGDNGTEVEPYDLDLKTELHIVITACDTTFKKN
ncbi:HD-GYP domain-containing protein [Neobacillus sp. PS3-34]|uniref:HD-GYP domain-containing protein n=1 Tax=Neobacillus sp. PS3-34 TaxID=3070678 RepID=UPI0027DF76C9|nr:HD-GYP domain-containing protein [Neobacillus sp. PS3-34]WML47063.1 HD-GYP domain-containing protein [Neobacillus sp. PS3-34]